MSSTFSIWKEFNEQLLVFIKSRVSDFQTAEDILQNVFIKIHTKIDDVQDENKIASWVYQITRNSIIDHYRKRKLNTAVLNLEMSLPEEITDIENDFSKCLMPFMERLAENEKDVLLSTAYSGVSQIEYAKLNGLTYSTVKSRVQRARKRLKEQFINCCLIEADQYGNILNSAEKGCTC